MRIGIDLSVIQSTKSGVDWYTHHVIKEIMGLLAPHEHLCLFANRETGFEKEAAGHPQVSVVRGHFRYQEPWRQLMLPALLRKHQIDVCFFTNFVLSVFAPCPMVLTIHDLSFKLFPRTHSLRNVVWARSLVPVSTWRAGHIIVDSNNTKLDLLTVMGVRESKISVVHLGASELYTPDPEPEDEEVLAHYGIVKPYVLYVGTLEPRKNLPMLIRSFDRVARTRSDLHLVLAGRRGWMAQAIFDELERRDLLGRVHITGYVKDENLPALYRQAAVFAYPSLYEGFGLPPLEAMSSGTPVIVSKSSSLPEVVGDAGLYVNPLDAEELGRAIESVVSDPALAGSLREKGLNRSRQFSWKKTAARTLEILREAARV
ncbi:MAG: glycosyltransferase family 4 protein [Thermoleophilia bacterium]|nr:glycosyltransferase family 4 protein [Thermoleophilia bacterium]